jgi:hypothetical protein
MTNGSEDGFGSIFQGGFATRRRFLRSSGLAAAAGLTALTAAGSLPGLASAATSDAPQALAEDAVIFGIPAVLMTRWLQASRQARFPIDQFYVNLDLSSPATHVVGPNDDTLYGLGWLDLAEGAQVIEVPDTHGRYYSIQLIDMWSNPFAYIGKRATGTKAGAFAITPPGFKGRLPHGVRRIPATTKRVLAFVRTFVKDPADLAAARKIHLSYTTGPLRSYPHGRLHPKVAANAEALNVLTPISLATSAVSLYETINSLIKEYPPLPADAAYARKLRPIGVDVPVYKQPGTSLKPVLQAAIAPAVAKVAAELAGSVTEIDGWTVVLGVTNITHDPLRRAALVIDGPGFQVEKEALYYSAAQLNGTALSGADSYVLRFERDQLPPAGAFWSLIMYDAATNYLVANPINRYEVASHTPGLVYGADGSLEIPIRSSQPTSNAANWLPSPAGDFRVVLRTYLPETPILDGSWKIPPLQLA